MLQIGLRAHDFGTQTPENLAQTLHAFKPVSIQLALNKAFCSPPQIPGGLTPGYAQRIYKIFQKHDINISVLGSYINPVHPDVDIRNKMLRSFEEHLRFARDFGCSIVGTETGSCNPDCSYHPDTSTQKTFDVLRSSLERLVNTAEKCGSIVGIEAVAGKHTISSIEAMQKIINHFNSPALKVIYDPANLIPIHGLEESQKDFFSRAFEAFGEHIVIVHAKDFIIENGIKNDTLPSGTGNLDYHSLLTIIMNKKPYIDILLENNSPDIAHKTFDFLRNIENHIQL